MAPDAGVTPDEAILSLARAGGEPPLKGALRQRPEDFRVVEIPRIEPAGEGGHAWLRVRKTGLNTADVAERLAAHAGVPPRDVGFAGLKDRHAVTEQWFSVGLAGKPEPDWQALAGDSLQVMESARHGRKLRRGALAGNRFEIRVRDVDGDRDEVLQRLKAVFTQGVPNYFGEQRFGRGGSNLATASRLFRDPRRRLSRSKRSLALSAARSLLFNRVLHARVLEGTWNRALAGDVMQLAGSHSYFCAQEIDEALLQRLDAFDIHPTGPLWGRGPSPARDECLALEKRVLADWTEWMRGLEAAGLSHDRRALRLVPEGPAHDWQGDDLVLIFTLQAGAFATAVLREIVSAA